MDVKLDFDNVMILPKSGNDDIKSRKDINLTVTYTINGHVWSGIPIISSNMSTIGTFEMYNVLSKYKMITCFHKYYTVEDYKKTILDKNYYMISSGILDHDYNNLINVINYLDPLFVCIDVANGYLKSAREFALKIKNMFPHLIITFGNVVSETDKLFDEYNIDIAKIGIGSGSMCSTRLKTGIGYPQFSLIKDSSRENKFIMSDGGCVYPGDISKAFGAGANFVMLGGMLAGHKECSGDIIIENGKCYKLFFGMSSHHAMNKKDNYKTSEGHEVKILYRGSVENTIIDILGGIRSTCSYTGNLNLQDLIGNCEFIRVLNQNNKSLL